MQVSSVNELLTADRYFYAHTWKIFRPRVKDTFCVCFRIKFVSNIRYQFYSIYPSFRVS